MAKITTEQAMLTYSLGQGIHAGSLGMAEAQRKITTAGMNPVTARDLILNVRHMLKGRAYKRHMGVEVTRSYIAWMRRDYGEEAAIRALSSVEEHLAYIERNGHGNLHPEYHVPLQPALRRLVAELKEKSVSSQTPFISPEEIPPDRVYLEGATRTAVVDRYERDPRARKECIKHHGTTCAVCTFDFEKIYGEIGLGFIHVHHLRDLASVGEAHVIDPKTDLRPVCPNCHAMLHRRTPPYSIDEMRAKLHR